MLESGKDPWVALACADRPGFLVPGACGAPPPELHEAPQRPIRGVDPPIRGTDGPVRRTDLVVMGHTPSTAGTFRKKFRKNSGKTPETLSELPRAL